MRLNLGQSSARWQLRLPQAVADALFPEQEAALSTVDSVEADVVATDQEGVHACACACVASGSLPSWAAREAGCAGYCDGH